MKNLLMAVTLISITGCATQTFTLQAGGSDQPTQETMHHFFISGLGQSKEIDAASVCGSQENVARVETHIRFLDGLLGSVTAGIYTPTTARVYCKS